jgi:sugar lactone lactonase YvrE
MRRTIWRYRFDAASGQLSERQEFARSSEIAVPDGAAVDAEGFVWSAQWGGACVVRYDPDGRIDRVLKVPVSQPSCVAFGGPNLDLLFVTTARSGLAAPEIGAGDLFVYTAPVRGLPESRFNFDSWLGAAGQ